MSQYDINDPRNPNSPYNMRNRHSPFYDLERAAKQSGELPIPSVGLGAFGGLAVIIFCLLQYTGILDFISRFPFIYMGGKGVVPLLGAMVAVLVGIVKYFKNR